MTDTVNGHNAARVYRPIADPAAWIEQLGAVDRTVLTTLGELFLGVTNRDGKTEDADAFTLRALGAANFGRVVDERRPLSGIERLTFARAVGELIDAHDPETGPGDHTYPPSWTETAVHEKVYRHPQYLRIAFPAGTLLDVACVVRLDARPGSYGNPPDAAVYIGREHQEAARTVLDRLSERAKELNPYRGKALRATYDRGLAIDVIELPASPSRKNVVVADNVWAEIDLGITAVRDRHELLNAHGLGSRRGVLLCGPPGTGKSAVSAVIARELVGDFTVFYCDARAGELLLTAVVEEAHSLGGPVLIVLEDLDLYCRQRSSSNSGGLSELLQAMDIQPDARILTLASTNDAATLDKAAVRTGRFDSIVEVTYPDASAAGRILAALVDGLPGGDTVEADTVAGRLPAQTSGSDIREIVRRAVLTGDGSVSTTGLLTEVGSGRYRATVPEGGQYL